MALKHPDHVPGWPGTLKELASAVENMSYDKTVEFVHHLDMAILSRALQDRDDNKPQLSSALLQVSKRLGAARQSLERVWRLCEEHMCADTVKIERPE